VADVNVTFGAVDEGLTSSIRKYETEIQELRKTPPMLTGASGQQYIVDPGTGNLLKYRQAVKEVTGATNELSEATEGMGQSAGRAGINIGAMMERMATRMVVFEGLRLGIQGVKAALDEVTSIAEAENRFERLSGSIQADTVAMKELKDSSLQVAGGLAQGEKVAEVLMNYGASAREAAVQTEALGIAARSLGGDEKELEKVQLRLAEAFGRMRLGEPADLRLLAEYTGKARDENLKLVNSYDELKRVGPAAIRAIDQDLQQLEQDTKKQEQAEEEASRAAEKTADRHLSAIEKIARGQDKAAQDAYQQQMKQYQQDLANSPLRAANMRAMGYGALSAPTPPTPPPAGGELGRELQAGGGPLVSREMLAQYQKGLEQLAQDAGQTVQEVQAEVKAGYFNVRDVMGRAKEARQDETEATRKNYRDQMEAARESARDQKEAIEKQTADAKEAAERGIRRAYVVPEGAPGAAPGTMLPALQQKAADTFIGGVRGFQWAVDKLIDAVVPVKDMGAASGVLEDIRGLLKALFVGG
jgi:hypothetical protein